MTTDWRASISQNRFSSIFESWIRPTSPEVPTGTIPAKEKTVSEPKLVAQLTGGTIIGIPFDSGDSNEAGEFDQQEFEHVLVSTGI